LFRKIEFDFPKRLPAIGLLLYIYRIGYILNFVKLPIAK